MRRLIRRQRNHSNLYIEKKPKLKGVRELLSESLKIFRSRLKPLIMLVFLQYVVINMITFIFIIAGLLTWQAKILPIWLVITGVLLGYFAMMALVATWLETGLLSVIAFYDEKIGVRKALSMSRSKVIPVLITEFFMIASLLSGLTLLIVPGIILGVWFCFYSWIVITENISGRNALWRSSQYVRGYGLAIVGRMAALLAIFFIIMVISHAVLVILNNVLKLNNNLIGLVENVLYFMAAPVMLVYSFLLFENLKQIKGKITSKITAKWKLLLPIAVVVGLVEVFLVGALVVQTVSFLAQFDWSKRAQEISSGSDIKTIQEGLNKYYNGNGVYPVSLSELSPVYLKDVPSKMPEYEAYLYQSTGTDYFVCIPNRDSRLIQCFSKDGPVRNYSDSQSPD